jgi:hypothetical protein
MFPIPFEASYWLPVFWRISSATGGFPSHWLEDLQIYWQLMNVIDKTLTRPTDVKNYYKKNNDFNVTQNIPYYEIQKITAAKT